MHMTKNNTSSVLYILQVAAWRECEGRPVLVKVKSCSGVMMCGSVMRESYQIPRLKYRSNPKAT